MRPRSRLPLALAAALGCAAVGLALGGPPADGGSTARAEASGGTPFVPSVARRRATVWAVGDGALAGSEGVAVAELIASRRVQRFIYLGDVYETGTLDEFEVNYRPVFGRFDPIAAPTPGNHEYLNRESGYDAYWEAARGRPVPDAYSFSAAGWQLISLDSIAAEHPGSEQLSWLGTRLRGTPRYGNCRIAFMHFPRYSAGMHGDHPALEPLWRRLRGHARLALAGHDHDMERFRPVGGLIQFISGAGGTSLRDADETDRRTAFVRDDRYGALRLELRRGLAVASFISVEGELLDHKRIRCRRAP